MFLATRGERLAFEVISPLWILGLNVLFIAVIVALFGRMTWTGGAIVAAVLTLTYAIRRRVEIDRASGQIMSAWVVSLSPRGPRLVLRELVHGRLGDYQHIHVLAVDNHVRATHGASVERSYHVQLIGRSSGLVGLTVANAEQNAALAGVFEVGAWGNWEAAWRVATRFSLALELPVRDPPKTAHGRVLKS